MQKSQTAGIKTIKKAPKLKEMDGKYFGYPNQSLFEIAAFVFSLKKFDKSARKIKSLLKEYMRARGCTIMFIDKYGYLWKVGDKTTYPFKVGEGVAGIAAKNKEEIYIKDTHQDERYKVLYKNNRRAIASIPIIRNKKVIGVVNFTYKDAEEMAASHLDRKTVNFFNEKFGYILENIILFHNVKEERNELKGRKSISEILDGKLSHKKRMEEMTKKIVEFAVVSKAVILPANLGRVSLFAENNITVLDKSTRTKKDLIELYKKNAGKQKEALVNISKSLDHTFITREGSGYSTLKPIHYGKKIIGFILIEDGTKNTNNFSTSERNFLNLVARQLEKYFAHHFSSKKIIKEKEKWRMIFQNDTDGVILLSQDRKIIEANPRAKEILGMKDKNLSGKDFCSLLKILDPELKSPTLVSLNNVPNFKTVDGKELSKKIDSFFKNHKSISPKEYLIETKNGRFWTTISINTTAWKKAATPFGIINICDITKKKELEQDKDDFISIVSHELRTPLSAMQGFISMITNGDYGILNAKQSKALGRVSESIERMIDLAEDLLYSSRIEIGRFCLVKEPINIRHIICKTVKELEPKIKEKKIQVKIQGESIYKYFKKRKCNQDCICPESDKNDIFVLADYDRIIQIMQNLLDNAVKYSYPKSTVEITFKEKVGTVEFRVKDKGVGISKEDQKKLFKKFQRIHNPLSKNVYGTGLGLYITQKLVEAHEGEVEVKSKENYGTTLIVRLPATKQLSFDLAKNSVKI